MSEEQIPKASNTTKSDWQQHVQTWQSSGLSQAAYCRKHKLKYNRFNYWKILRLGAEPNNQTSNSTAEPPAQSAGFVKLNQNTSPSGTACVHQACQITLARGAVISLPVTCILEGLQALKETGLVS